MPGTSGAVLTRTGPREQFLTNDVNNDVGVIMGCVQSKNKVASLPEVHQNTSAVSQSSCSDEDSNVPDALGGNTFSNADLINVQRQEKTDVNVALENRWLKHHFSDHNAFNGHHRNLRKFQSEPIRRHNETRDINQNIVENNSVHNQGSFYEREYQHQNYDCEIQANDTELNEQELLFKLSILHFNDVYELTERNKEPVGGASRFTSSFLAAYDQITRNNGTPPLTIFSGDCLNPSTLSSATKGEHMVEVLNYLKLDAAVFGNHEFDFGVEHAAKCVKKMNFPWFLSNVVDLCTGRPLGDGIVSNLLEWNNGVKIGLVGLIEEEWLDTLATVDKTDLEFTDFVERGRELCTELRNNGADIIIALTHMRWPNDIRLAQEVEQIDIILGGHDHEYGVREVKGCVIVKSGSDFRTFSQIDVFKSRVDRTLTVGLTRHDITRSQPEDHGMKQIVDKFIKVLDKQLERPIGSTLVNLEGRYNFVRTRETNLGNMIADIMRMATKADIVLINSGTFRSNEIHMAGKFKVRDLMTILPIHDTIVLLEVTGHELIKALENSVSKYPLLEGRFPQISGFTFAFDKHAPANERVLVNSVCIQGTPLQLDRVYKLATKAYVARGRDGYTCLKKCALLSDPDSGPLLSTVVRNHICSVHRMVEYQTRRNCKVEVSQDGKQIAVRGGSGSTAEAFDIINREEDVAPVDTLRESMEKLMELREENSPRRGNHRHLMQHLVEVATEEYFVDNIDIVNSWREAIEKSEKENVKLLKERAKFPNDIKWQVTPLIEGRIFLSSKAYDV